MNKNLPVKIGLLLLIILGCLYFFVWQKPQDEIHYHAGFKLFVDGIAQDFSDPKYMSIIPCGAHSEKNNPALEQIEKAHLHDQQGTVVHVHREGAVWGDLFTNISYFIDSQKPLRAFSGTEEVSSILLKPITPYESVIILVGTFDSNRNYFSEAVTQAEIKAAEKKSENCGS